MCETDFDGQKELEEVIYAAERCYTEQDMLKVFIQSYNENIWDAAVSMYCEHADDKDRKTLGEYIKKLNKLCFEEENVTSSFLYKTYDRRLRNSINSINTAFFVPENQITPHWIWYNRRLRNSINSINTAFFVPENQITPHWIWYNRVVQKL